MRKAFMFAPAMAALLAGTATAQDAQEVKIGHLAGFTGPIESLAPTANQAVRMAVQEVSDSGFFLNGSTASVVDGDSTCTDAAVATASAEVAWNPLLANSSAAALRRSERVSARRSSCVLPMPGNLHRFPYKCRGPNVSGSSG